MKPRNKTLNKFKFFPRKQQQHESLRQFSNVLTALPVNPGQQTERLILDACIQNMNNKRVHERLCTEPKEQVEDAIRFAITF